jgi:hypothetical protein
MQPIREPKKEALDKLWSQVLETLYGGAKAAVDDRAGGAGACPSCLRVDTKAQQRPAAHDATSTIQSIGCQPINQ